MYIIKTIIFKDVTIQKSNGKYLDKVKYRYERFSVLFKNKVINKEINTRLSKCLSKCSLMLKSVWLSEWLWAHVLLLLLLLLLPPDPPDYDDPEAKAHTGNQHQAQASRAHWGQQHPGRGQGSVTRNLQSNYKIKWISKYVYVKAFNGIMLL